MSKIDRKGFCSLHQPNGGFKVTHGCSTPTFQLLSLVLLLRLHESPLLELCRMVLLYLISGGGPSDTRGGINRTNGRRTAWKQLSNTDIDSDNGKDKKSHSSLPGLLGQILRIIQHLRVLEPYLGKTRVTKSHSGLLLPKRRH